MELTDVHIYGNIKNRDTGKVTFVRKNFSGKPDIFNNEGGKHYFYAYVTKEQADMLISEGIDVNIYESNNPEYEEPQYSVKINFKMDDNRLPQIYKVENDVDAYRMSKAQIENLDNVIITKADLIISPYAGRFNKDKCTAWLNAMYVTIELRGLRAKYNYVDVED